MVVVWPALDRYDLVAAPGGVGLVHDFLSTASAGKPREPDLLGGVSSAQRWVDGATREWATTTGQERPAFGLTEPDCRVLREFRGALLTALIDRAEPRAGDDSGRITSPRARARLEIELDADGIVRVFARGNGWRAVVAWVLSEVYRAQQSGEWSRLKACRNDRCRGVFYDRSRNNSGVWHDVRSCGNAINLRASRARRKQGTH